MADRQGKIASTDQQFGRMLQWVGVKRRAGAPAGRLRRIAGTLAALALAVVVRIHDGDTVTLDDGTRVRLWGIDAPELAQTCQDADGRSWACGKRARDALVAYIGGRPIDCQYRDRDRYGRLVAACSAGGQDLGTAMVRDGWAVAFTRYTDRYAGDEAEARRAGRGLWAGRFQAPEEWRQEHRRD